MVLPMMVAALIIQLSSEWPSSSFSFCFLCWEMFHDSHRCLLSNQESASAFICAFLSSLSFIVLSTVKHMDKTVRLETMAASLQIIARFRYVLLAGSSYLGWLLSISTKTTFWRTQPWPKGWIPMTSLSFFWVASNGQIVERYEACSESDCHCWSGTRSILRKWLVSAVLWARQLREFLPIPHPNANWLYPQCKEIWTYAQSTWHSSAWRPTRISICLEREEQLRHESF